MSQKQVTLDAGIYRFECPSCNISLEVQQTQLNCQVFRCGVFKSNNQPINPHCPKALCEQYIKNKLIWGCAKPFKFVKGSPPHVEKCGYI